MDLTKQNAPRGRGAEIVQLWRADTSNYNELAELEQRLWGQFQTSIYINDCEPSKFNERAIYNARDAWLYAHDRLLQAERPA